MMTEVGLSIKEDFLHLRMAHFRSVVKLMISKLALATAPLIIIAQSISCVALSQNLVSLPHF